MVSNALPLTGCGARYQQDIDWPDLPEVVIGVTGHWDA